MRRFSVQVSEDLWSGLQDLAKRERKSLQQMLRDILQAVVDGDDPGRVVSAGTREAIDALREQQRRDAGRWAEVIEAIDALGNKQKRDGNARARLLTDDLYSLRDKVDLILKADQAERASLAAVLKGLQDGMAELQAGVGKALESQLPPAHDEARRGRRGLFGGGGGER